MRLVVGFSVALLIILIGFLISYRVIIKDYRAKDRVLNSEVQEATNAASAARLRDEMSASLRAYLLTGDSSELKDRDRTRTKYFALLNTLRGQESSVDSRVLAEKILDDSAEMHRISENLIRKKARGSKRVLAEFESVYLPKVEQIERNLNDLTDNTERRLSLATQRSLRLTQSGTRKIILFTSLALALALLIVMSVAHRLGQLFRQVQASEGRFRKAVQTVGEIAWEREVGTGRVHLNEGIVRNWGYPPAARETSYEWFLGLVHPDDRERALRKMDAAIQSKQEYVRQEIRMRKHDGSYASIIGQSFLIYAPTGKLERTVGSLVDVTHLRQAIQARDDMVAVISHELKNPLTAIGASIELIERMIPKRADTTSSIAALENMKSPVLRMHRLVTDLLDITRIEARTLPIAPSPGDFGELCAEILASSGPIAQAKGLRIESYVEPDLPKIRCDRQRIAQVISNIIGNAIKFTPPGGLIALEARRRGDHLMISITDTGKGIAPENLGRIFDRFWQAKELQSTGSGLGLAISKGIVEAHGGKIWARSALGKGTSILVSIPFAGPAALQEEKSA